MIPGTRVVLGDDDPDKFIGTVVEPTAEELAYVNTWSLAEQEAIRGWVIVHGDLNEPWDRGWYDPSGLLVVEDVR